jgi:diguanylate cyclase (GGDEF)-like protein/PAS domain S-box-containing protein
MDDDRFYELANDAPVIVWVTDPDGKTVFINSKWTEFTGQPIAEALVFGWVDCVHPDDKERVTINFEEAARNRSRYHVEYRLLSSTGEARWIIDHGSPRFGHDGKFLGYVGGVTDIHELKSTEGALYLSNQRFHAAIEAVEGIMWTCDGQGRFVDQQPGWEKITGQTLEQYLGYGWSSVLHPEEQESFMAKAQYCIATGEPLNAISRVANPQGKWRHYSVRAMPVKQPDGSIKEWVGVHTDITERLAHEEKVLHLATHDPLTNLTNRTVLNDRITHLISQRKDAHHAVLFIDLNSFKIINDSLGHHIGDELLVKVAGRLKQGLRAGDTVSRFGGDEFVVLLANVKDEAAVAHTAIKLLDRIAKTMTISNHEFAVSASIGIAMFPRDGGDTATLLRHADRAMYNAKSIGGGAFKFYTKSINTSLKERLELENYLRKALVKEELRVAFQPKVSVKGNAVIGFEALIRWLHPERGTISPLKFIPLAEDIGLISPIGEWVLLQAAQQLKEFDRLGHPDLNISVNLSVVQLKDPGFIDRIKRVFATTGINPARIEFELTESRLMEDIAVFEPLLFEIKALGSHLAIDDFGTGYSSLTYLKKLPIETLKIDKSFVDDVLTDRDDAAIVLGTVLMAKQMELNIVAEGVETREQAEFLVGAGCDCMQGYLFGKPLYQEDLEAFIANFRDVLPDR